MLHVEHSSWVIGPSFATVSGHARVALRGACWVVDILEMTAVGFEPTPP